MDGTFLGMGLLALVFALFLLTLRHYRDKCEREGGLGREARRNYLMIMLGLSAAGFLAAYGLCLIYQVWILSHRWPLLLLALGFALFELRTNKRRMP